MPEITVLNAPDESLLTHSRAQCAKTCLRKHYFRYELGVRRDRQAQPLRFGTAFHLGLDVCKRGASQEEAIREGIKQYDKVPEWANTEELVYDWMIEREKVGRMLSGYFWRYHADPQKFEVVATEQSFTVPLRNPQSGGTSRTFIMAGKMDGIIKLADQRLALMEHKTASDDLSPESDYWKRLAIDSQISLYYLAAIEKGYDLQTVIYDVVRKPTIQPTQIPELDDDGCKIVVDKNGERVFLDSGKPRQSGNKTKGWMLISRKQTPSEYGQRLTKDIMARPEFYFARREIPRLRADLEEAKQEFWDVGKQLIECRNHGRWFRNTQACLMMGRCEYFDICSNGMNPGDTLPSGYTQVQILHEELQ